ncbi:hypothetical protein E2C01_038817 [Portunus trituberculatus]|uniref:Uncharacterized protein n=1 Tax=Portunus trituberculatus TaxID=210409 RepID=A0A5B7FF57_PORTR|nr:hypothetical protein [Portunus trituberculatus]
MQRQVIQQDIHHFKNAIALHSCKHFPVSGGAAMSTAIYTGGGMDEKPKKLTKTWIILSLLVMQYL